MSVILLHFPPAYIHNVHVSTVLGEFSREKTSWIDRKRALAEKAFTEPGQCSMPKISWWTLSWVTLKP